jgi:hypothetical protein
MHCVANTLGVMQTQLEDWIRVVEQEVNSQTDKSTIAQSNGAEHTNPDGRNNPTQMAETTQSITSSDQQENNAQSDDSTNNSQSNAVVVTYPCGDPDNTLLDRLEVLGISHAKSAVASAAV